MSCGALTFAEQRATEPMKSCKLVLQPLRMQAAWTVEEDDESVIPTCPSGH
jgi:hypothetical protein